MEFARLQGKVAIITGAASGIGRAMALKFLREGAIVVAVDNRLPELNELTSLAPSDAVLVTCQADVGERADLEKSIADTVRRFSRLDILCNNAGVSDGFTPVADLTDALWEHVLKVDLTSAVIACRFAIPSMIRDGGGVILNTASIAGFRGGRSGTAYTVAKHGLIGLTRSIASFYGAVNIRCNAICPGSVDTNVLRGVEVHPAGLALRERGYATKPRVAQADDIADVGVFLASDEARYVNGAVIVADAGWTTF
jgi:NAD(P)-dependent dehydrogenase (short-subunit alcohol dehydrogenase family)